MVMNGYSLFKKCLSLLHMLEKGYTDRLINEGWLSLEEYEQLLTILERLNLVMPLKDDKLVITLKGLSILSYFDETLDSLKRVEEVSPGYDPYILREKPKFPENPETVNQSTVAPQPEIIMIRRYNPELTSGRNYWAGYDNALTYNTSSITELRAYINNLKMSRIDPIHHKKVYCNKFFREGFIMGLNSLIKIKLHQYNKKHPVPKLIL